MSTSPNSNLAEIRGVLRRDPSWCVYALGDLDPRRQHHCDWFVDGSSLALLYREFDTPILFATGSPDILAALPPLDSCLLQVPERFATALERHFTVQSKRLMLRLALDPAAFVRPEHMAQVEALGSAHEGDLRGLYDDGKERGEDPDFFMRGQLEDETFFGVRDAGQLVSAGGTHLYSAVERVGAIGNVYTRRSHRSRGYAAAVTAAVVERLIARGTETIGLNVKSGNAAALGVYERLGFRAHARFWEGRAVAR